MAEQEIVKHTKKVYKIWNSKEHGFWFKLQEFLIEISIIVFAVSLSIWLHERSEHATQQQEVKEFLTGLRQDLLSDIKEMNEDKNSYMQQELVFSYISGVKLKESINPDSLKKYDKSLLNTTRFQQNNGRFEGFKASGKIGTIEDNLLQDNIMDLYQENIPSLLASTDNYIRRKNQLIDFYIKNQKRFTDSTSNTLSILKMDEAQNLAGFLARPVEIIQRYDICIGKMNAIVKDIEEMYHIKKE
jgi:hypothetical protein